MPETLDMGRVVVSATVENLGDLLKVHEGLLPAAAVRRISIDEALVDTGATTLCLPSSLVAQLGLVSFGERVSMTSSGPRKAKIYGSAKLTVQGRDCNVDVVELPDGVPALIGQVPLELLDFVVDPPGRRLIGNPAHGGEQMLELY
ncbi:MAG: retropepsin-like aspartic protease [Planctomycetaceae bacterium]|nr:retropepsin-like aspartic protease [Planctomycetaceae bacterium]